MYVIKPFKNVDEDWLNSQNCDHLFYSYSWLQTLEDTYGFDIQVLTDDKDAFIMAFCPVTDVRGSRIINLPFSDYTPSCELNVEDYNRILEFLKDQYPSSSIIMKTDLPGSASINAKVSREAVYHTIPIIDENTPSKSSSFKRNTRKALEQGLNFRITSDHSALENFYTLYHQLRFEKFNSIPQPMSFFNSIYQNFINRGNGFILEVLYNNKVIASSIVLQHGTVLYYKFGCSAEDHLGKKPNNLLFSELISYAKENKITEVDLGLSGTSKAYEGLRRWKESMGGIPHPVTYWEFKPETVDLEREQKVLKNLDKLTQSMIDSKLNPRQTSAFSEKIYPLFA